MNWRKWLDGFILAGNGIFLATKQKRFWYGSIPSFIIFSFLMNMLSGGLSKFELIRILGFPESLRIIGENLLAILGINQPFLDWLQIFCLAMLQSILIGLIVFLWQKKKNRNSPNSANVEKVGIITGLIALGAGCPTCGTTLITPLIGAVFSTGGLSFAGTISTAITWLAVIIAILSIKRLGEETYVTIINEKYLARHASKKELSEKSN